MRANSDAVNDEPRTDSTVLGSAESEIVKKTKTEGLAILESAEQGCTEIERKKDEAAESKIKIQDDLKKLVSREAPRPLELTQAEEKLSQAQAHLRMFMKEHGLRRHARIPESRFWIFSVVLAVVVAEGAINSYFFAAASDFGLLGGFLQAFFVSGVNVAFAFIGGYLMLRQLVHKNPGRNLAGLIGLFAVLMMIVLINLMAAQYRGFLEQNIENPGNAVIERLLSLDFSGALNSINSVLLVLVGLLCAFFSGWKGYSSDDPYPGYGDMQRDVNSAMDIVREVKDESEDILYEWGEDQRNELKEIRKRLDDMRLSLIELHDSCPMLARFLTFSSGEELCEIAHQLLSFYREENRRIRATPAPDYFSRYPSVQDLDLGARRNEEDIKGRIAVLVTDLKAMLRELTSMMEQIDRKASEMRLPI